MCGWVTAASDFASARSARCFPVLEELFRQDLQGHRPVEACVLRPVDLSHTARADGTFDLVGASFVPGVSVMDDSLNGPRGVDSQALEQNSARPRRERR